MKIIDEVKEITATEVSKKQDAAKLNFPNLVEKIKKAARQGKSVLVISEHEINEYDRKLLQQEGFRVSLIDEPASKFNDYKSSFMNGRKVWEIYW